MSEAKGLRAELERTREENKKLRQQLLEITLVDLDLDSSKGMGLVAARQYPKHRSISLLAIKDWLINEYGSPVQR